MDKDSLFHTSQGFTLLEIMLCLLIFAFIAIGTTQVIRNSSILKTKIDEDIDTYQALRSAVSILHKDISNIFNLNTMDFLPYGHLLPDQRDPTLQDPVAYQNYIDQNFPALKYKSYFIGEKTEMHFTSSAHFRLYSNLHESDLEEVSYFTETDKALPNVVHLYKRNFPIIDNRPTEGGAGQIILEDLSEVTFRYYDLAKDQWMERWDSRVDANADEIPDTIEVKLVVNKRNLLSDEVKKLELALSIKPTFGNSFKKPRIGGLDSLEKELSASQTQNNTGTGTGTSTGNPLVPSGTN